MTAFIFQKSSEKQHAGSARRGFNNLISRRSIIQILALGALLIGARLAVDLTSAGAYVYPEYDFGQFWFAFLLFLVSLLFVAILIIIRLFQKRFIEGLALFAVLCIPFSFKDAVDRHYWKFRLHKSEYQSAIQADSNPPPKYRVFNWGNRNTHLMGGGFIVEGIVYDESDEVGRAPDSRSPGWLQRRSNSSPQDLWVIAPSGYPTCRKLTKPFGEHFYYLAKEC
jgi:uncharacterized membrane protein